MKDKCKPISGKVTGLFLFKDSDAVVEAGGVVRIKRKYGKFKREPVYCSFEDKPES